MSASGFWRVFFRGIEGRFIALLLTLALCYSLSWTGFFIVPVALTVSKDEIIFVRKTPFGTVNADWVMEATSLDGTECPPASGTSIYQPKADNTVRLVVPPVLAPCLQGAAVVEISKTVRFFGIPLRPLRITTISEAY
jgi:hypothetical protein